jgi:hypothetical protein
MSSSHDRIRARQNNWLIASIFVATLLAGTSVLMDVKGMRSPPQTWVATPTTTGFH